MKRVVLAIDRPDWAFDHIAAKVAAVCRSDFDVAVVEHDKATRDDGVDVVVAFWWGALPRLSACYPHAVRVMCLYDEYYWRPESRICDVFGTSLEFADVIFLGCEQLGEVLSHRHPHARWIPQFIVEDGVDLDLFPPMPLPEKFTLGWCGTSAATALTSGGEERKRLHAIRRCAEEVGAPLLVHDASITHVPHQEMADSFYGKISCYINFSISEGTPNTVLEAMACGRPVITSRCGITARVVTELVNGYFVETEDDLRLRMGTMTDSDVRRMGASARVAVIPHSWSTKVFSWYAAISQVAYMSSHLISKKRRH